MKFIPIIPPRTFVVSDKNNITLKECARICLEADEQVTFITDTGTEHDLVRKSWGYYATASTNSRLPAHGLRPLLARNKLGHHYILLVEKGKENDLFKYLESESMIIVLWLDGTENLDIINKEKKS